MRKPIQIQNIDNPDVLDVAIPTVQQQKEPDNNDGSGMTAGELRTANYGNTKQLSLSQDQITQESPENSIKPPTPQKEIPFFQGIGKGFKAYLDDNTVLSTTRYINDNGFNIIPEQINPDYDPFNDIPKDKLNYIDNYKFANTPEEVQKISNRIDRELENKRILNEEVGTGASIASGIFAGILDPINLIPVGGEAFKAWKIGEIGQGILKTATQGLVSSTAAEGILQAEQETRTKEESAMNIASTTLLSGILGGAAAKFSKGEFNDLSKRVNEDITTDKAPITIDPETQKVVPFTKNDSIKELDPEVKKTVNDFLYNHQPVSNDDVVKLESQKQDLQNQITQFDNNRENLSNESNNNSGESPSYETIQEHKDKIINFIAERDQQRTEVDNNEELIKFDEETKNQLEELKSNANQDKFKEISEQVKQQKQNLLDQYKETNRKLEEIKTNIARQNLERTKPEIKSEVQPNELSEILLPPEQKIDEVLPEEPRNIGAKQVRSYDNLYNEYLEKNLPTGKQPITYEQFRGGLESLTSVLGGKTTSKVFNTLGKVPILGRVTDRTQKIFSGINKINPLLRVFHSMSTEAKVVLQELATHNMLVGKNDYGIASQQSVENAIKFWRGGLGEALPHNNKMFKEFKERINKEGGKTPIKTQIDFNIEVSKALRRGDKSSIPEVEKSAKVWREKVFEPLKNAAIEQGLLPKDVKPETAISYLSRLWNKKAIIAKEPELRAIIQNKLLKVELPKIEAIRNDELQKLANKVSELEKRGESGELEKARDKFNEERYKFEADFEDKESYAREITDNIISNLKGETRFGAVSNYDFKITTRGPLKERTLNFIRDEEVEQFLENDIEQIADRYTRIMGTDVELARKFDGDVNMEKRLNQVKEDFERIAAKATTDEQRTKIQKDKINTINDLKTLKDVMRGTYGSPENPDSLIVRGFRVARALNYVSKLGGVVLSSLNDPINAIGVHGIGRFSEGLGHLITNMKGVKLNIKEAEKAGNILENILHTRLASYSEIMDPLNTGHSVFERFIDNVAKLGSKFNGIGLWTDGMKSFTSVMTQQRLIKESLNLLNGKIKKSDSKYLAFLGIDESNVKSITNQIDKFATKEGRLWVANTEQWTDKEAVRLYRNALNQDVDRTITTPTKGDVPLFMHKEIGKTIGQFKSFTFAGTQQVLIRSLQQRDVAALNGFISAVTMGMLVYYLKTVAAGRDVSDDPRKWILEGIDRSGITGILMEINNLSEKMTRGKVGLNAVIGGEIMSRYASRNLASTLAGPTAGSIQDLATITGAISSGDIAESDVKAFRNMLPFQNVFYLQKLFDELESKTDEAVGATSE